MKKIMILTVAAIFSSSVFAKPAELAKFKTTYPNATALHKCATCHSGTGYKERNDFGKALEANNNDLKAIEGFDSDVDGFTNLDEINAGTQPGNKDSHPASAAEPTPVVEPAPAA